MKKTSKHFCLEVNVREKIRTPDTLVRSQVLYPAELHVHSELLFLVRRTMKMARGTIHF